MKTEHDLFSVKMSKIAINRQRNSLGRFVNDPSVKTRTEKQCSRCGIVKPLNAFHRCNSKGDGHVTTCKECMRMYRRERHINQYSPKKRHQRFLKYREKILARGRKYNKEHRFECNSRLKARRKVTLGKKCKLCGSTENLVRHHPDYNKPFVIVTLCKSCHFNVHLGKVILNA